MQYLGGKARQVGQEIATFLNEQIKGRKYAEPFVGGANVLYRIRAPYRLAGDVHPDLICMWKALQYGWVPLDNIPEDLFKVLKTDSVSPLRGFAGFACAYGGQWFGGYAKSKISGTRRYSINHPRYGQNYNYAKAGKRSVLKQIVSMLDVDFRLSSFLDLDIEPNSVVYCDPPYQGTAGYGMEFNHSIFWDWARLKAKSNEVYVSEMSAPRWAEPVLTFKPKVWLSGKTREESLFRVHP